MSNFIEAAVVGGAGQTNAESATINRIPVGARLPEVAVVGGSESDKLPLIRTNWRVPLDKYLPQAAVVGEFGTELKKKE